MPAANTYDRSEGQAEAVSGSTIRYPTSNWILLLLGLSVLINYIDRSNLSIAALADTARHIALGILLDICLPANPSGVACGPL
jgi:hypothetical protein